MTKPVKELPMDIDMGRGPRYLHTIYVNVWIELWTQLAKHNKEIHGKT